MHLDFYRLLDMELDTGKYEASPAVNSLSNLCCSSLSNSARGRRLEAPVRGLPPSAGAALLLVVLVLVVMVAVVLLLLVLVVVMLLLLLLKRQSASAGLNLRPNAAFLRCLRLAGGPHAPIIPLPCSRYS